MEKIDTPRVLKIAVTGPESTGKSKLSEDLALYLRSDWVREYAREYLKEHGPGYQLEDLIAIGEGQLRLEQDALKSSPPVLVFDTEMTVLKIWARVVFGVIPPRISEWQQQQKFDFYLLCDIDLPWESDPLREHPDRREELFGLYLAEMQQMGYTFGIVRGRGKDRLDCALQYLKNLKDLLTNR